MSDEKVTVTAVDVFKAIKAGLQSAQLRNHPAILIEPDIVLRELGFSKESIHRAASVAVHSKKGNGHES